MNLSPDVPPHQSAMSELDTLSDSDWLDIASGRDSDDNDSLSEQDSDRDEMSSLPRSRRSSISNEDSMSSDVEAWEGFVSDSGEAVIGMYPVPLPSPLGAEPIALGDIPDNTSVADPALSDEERRVKEALDQSFVGTLNSSRSSAHTSIRDLRLSFPDPLTSSRNDLNRSYETVSSPTETMESSAEDDTNVPEVVAPNVVPPQVEDPGLFTTPVVQHQHQEAPIIEHKEALEIVLYGSSSEIKWKFLQQLIEKAAMSSGHVLTDSLRESTQAQSLSLVSPSGSRTPFFDIIDVSDRTTERAKLETDIFVSLERPSLAIVYLPAAQLPDLSWHTSYLPVIIPSVGITDQELAVQAAEDDWDLLAVPPDRTLNLGYGKSPILDANELANIHSTRVYEALRSIGHDSKKITGSKALTEQVKSMNAVTLFALMSIIMGFAFNTTFRSSTPTPTPTVNIQSPNTGHIWNFFSPQPNRSILAPLTGNQQSKSGSSGSSLSATPSLKDMALSVFNPGSTSLSVTSPPSAKSLSISSTTTNAIAKMTTTSPTAKCRHCESSVPPSADKPTTSTDLAPVPTSLTPSIYVRPSGSVISHPGSASTILLAGADRAGSISKSIVVPVASAAANINLNLVTEALDATTKALAEAVGNDLAELAEAADELFVSLREQTDHVIRQSKGKARAFGEQIQNLNEELVSRNERAKRRAKELKKKGEEMVRGATNEFKKRTTRAKKRARALKKSVVDGSTEAWKTYEKSQADWESALSGRKRARKDKENAGARPHACHKKMKRASANICV